MDLYFDTHVVRCTDCGLIEFLKGHLGSAVSFVRKKLPVKPDYERRDVSIDVLRGIMIILMLVGHFSMDQGLRTVIYSCHMMAFVFFSGYFFKHNKTLKNTVKDMVKTLILPYMVFVVLIICLNYDQWSAAYLKDTVIKYMCGMSFSGKLFTDISSVGPVYFILMLFLVRVIYKLIDQILKLEWQRWVAVLVISVAGMTLGNSDFWLPWSLDCACYSLIFYKLGLFFKEKDILKFVKNNHITYFILSTIWVYMIYAGGMELAVRNYGKYSLVIVGSVAGILVIYKFSVFIADKLPLCSRILSEVGSCTVYVLIIHTLISGYVGKFVSLRFTPGYTAYLVCAVLLQIIIAVVAANVLKLIGRFVYRIKQT